MNSTQTIRLPRRAQTMRALGREIATKQLTELTARQAFAYRTGYVAAVLTGGVAFWLLGWPALIGVALLYTLAAYRAYRWWRRLSV